jgi:hypothetical protein
VPEETLASDRKASESPALPADRSRSSVYQDWSHGRTELPAVQQIRANTRSAR